MSSEPKEGRGFDPSRYLTKVGSSDYLEVKWRLVWLRDVFPDAVIETDDVVLTDRLAVFKATITLPTGGKATGYGSESPDDFRDHIEKSETKAIGRALAALGFGTQFTPDFDFGGGSGKVVDAPIDFAATRGRRERNAPADDAGRRIASVNQPATPRQHKFLQDIAREMGIVDVNLEHEAQTTYGCAIGDLNRKDASAFIERLQARKAGGDFSDGAAETPAQTATEPKNAPQRPQPAPKASRDVKPENAPYGPNTGATEADSPNLRKLHSVAKERGLSHQELHAIANSRGVGSLADLSPEQCDKFAAWLNGASPDAMRSALEKAGIKLIPDEEPATAGSAGNDTWTR